MSAAVIVDLDGTLVDVREIAHLVQPPERDFAAFHAAARLCPVWEPVAIAVRQAAAEGLAVLVVTSREFIWRDPTLDWLVAHDIAYTQLVMRVAGDYRPDLEVKAEMLQRLRAGGYEILRAWEDSDDVVEMFQANGVEVVRVEQ